MLCFIGRGRMLVLDPFLGNIFPDGQVYGANMGPTWGRQDLGGPHVDPMDHAIWVRSREQATDQEEKCSIHIEDGTKLPPYGRRYF